MGTFSATIPEGQACLSARGRHGSRAVHYLAPRPAARGVWYRGGNGEGHAVRSERPGASPWQQPLFDTGLPVGGGGFFIRGRAVQLEQSRWIRPRCSFPMTSMPRASTPCASSASIKTFTTHAGPSFQAGAMAGECTNDMAVGNFDHQQANPGLPPPATIANPNLQVAIPFTDCNSTHLPCGSSMWRPIRSRSRRHRT